VAATALANYLLEQSSGAERIRRMTIDDIHKALVESRIRHGAGLFSAEAFLEQHPQAPRDFPTNWTNRTSNFSPDMGYGCPVQRMPYGASSVKTWNDVSVHGPKLVTKATSVASRPRAIRILPMRGLLCRASNVYQRSPR
jgi:hypothetical protein